MIDHKDKDKRNNIMENLRWVSASFNIWIVIYPEGIANLWGVIRKEGKWEARISSGTYDCMRVRGKRRRQWKGGDEGMGRDERHAVWGGAIEP